MDPQTGYYYYGARYYDPTMSIFLSVDPLAEQFPGWTPYHYVHNNPINLVDPTGMSAEVRDHDYKVEPNGDLNLVKKTNDNFDTVTNTNGESIKVNKGVIKEENLNKNIATQNGDNYTYNIYKFDDKKSAVEFYDFMSNPKTNDVEYSISELENSSAKYYTVGTSKEYSAEVSWSISFGNDFQKDKSTKLNEHTHTHFFKRGPSDADKVAKNRFFEIYKNQNTEFKIDCRNCTYGSERETLTH